MESQASSDLWLERWLPLIARKAAAGPVLEIGCGSGVDTVRLVTAGLDVIAFDISDKAVARARQRTPQAHIECRDVREPLPVKRAGVGLVVASLSLHYFPWMETVELVSRIHEVLWPGGVLLCRLNSTEDHHYGACGHEQIEANYFRVDGRPKRFFDEAAVRRLFAGRWRQISMEHYVIHRYERPKALWEIIVEKTLAE